jgi:hypothetical protein
MSNLTLNQSGWLQEIKRGRVTLYLADHSAARLCVHMHTSSVGRLGGEIQNVGVEAAILKILKSAAMKLICSALGDKGHVADLGELRIVVERRDFHLGEMFTSAGLRFVSRRTRSKSAMPEHQPRLRNRVASLLRRGLRDFAGKAR